MSRHIIYQISNVYYSSFITVIIAAIKRYYLYSFPAASGTMSGTFQEFCILLPHRLNHVTASTWATLLQFFQGKTVLEVIDCPDNDSGLFASRNFCRFKTAFKIFIDALESKQKIIDIRPGILFPIMPIQRG